jgi:tetratricopeptide (TPR) repeat protein
MARSFLLFSIALFILTACKDKKSESKKHLNEGVRLMYESKFEESLQMMEKAISIDPESFEAYYHYGNCLRNLRRNNEAMDAYNTSISLNSEFADAFYNRGLLRELYGDAEGACEDYKKAEALGKPNVSDKTRRCF